MFEQETLWFIVKWMMQELHWYRSLREKITIAQSNSTKLVAKKKWKFNIGSVDIHSSKGKNAKNRWFIFSQFVLSVLLILIGCVFAKGCIRNAEELFSIKVKTLSIRNPLGLMSFCRFRIATFCTHHALPPTTNRRPICSRDPYRDMPRHSPSLIVISFATSRHSFRSVIMARFTLRTFDG